MPDERGGHTQLHHARGHDLLHEIKRPGATQKFSSNSAKRIRLHSLQLGERFNPLGQALGWTATRPERRRYCLCEQLRFLVRGRCLYHSSSGGDTKPGPRTDRIDQRGLMLLLGRCRVSSSEWNSMSSVYRWSTPANSASADDMVMIDGSWSLQNV